jgi:hypothetical protein
VTPGGLPRWHSAARDAANAARSEAARAQPREAGRLSHEKRPALVVNPKGDALRGEGFDAGRRAARNIVPGGNGILSAPPRASFCRIHSDDLLRQLPDASVGEEHDASGFVGDDTVFCFYGRRVKCKT